MKKDRNRRVPDTTDDIEFQPWTPESPAFAEDGWQQDTLEDAFAPEEKIYPHSI